MTIIPSAGAAVHVSLPVVLSAATLFSLYKSRRRRPPSLSSNPPKLIFLSETGTSEALARRLLPLLDPLSLLPAALYDPEDLPTETLVVIVASTWQDKRPFLLDWLAEAETDFRAGSLLLRKCRFAVFGVGSSAYVGDAYNSVARDIYRRMRALGASEVVGLGLGDILGPDLDRVFDKWAQRLVRQMDLVSLYYQI